MASTYNSDGYQRLRELAHTNFTHLALIDDTGTEITRIDLSSDSRVISSSDGSSNPLSHSVEVTGYDSDISNPVTIASTELYETSSSTTNLGSDSMTNATIEAEGDTVTVTHEQQLPPM